MAEADKIFKEVAKLLSDQMGVKQASIAMETSLFKDCGMAGDDADEFFELLDDKYQVDWESIDLGLMFGSEGITIKFPWNIHKDRELIYKTQPCLVSDIVHAIDTAKWMPKALYKKSPFRIGISYLISVAFYGILASILIAAILDEYLIT